MTLTDLAQVAHFSPFHFHRIFGAMMGETLNNFIQRVRLEKAATLLLNNPKKSITEIAFECGFSGSAPFARAFKEAFRMSASQWRSGGYNQNSKIRQVEGKESQLVGKNRKEFDISSYYINDVNFNQIWRIIMKNQQHIQAEIKVKNLPELHVAYVRHIGPYKGNSELFKNLIEKLMTWAGPRDLIKFPDTKLLNVYHDNPEITDESKHRLSVCISVPPDTKVDGEIGKMVIPGGKYAVGYFEIGSDEFQAAWNTIFGGWFPESGYQPADGVCFEICLNNPEEHPDGKHIVEICVPVMPL